MAARNVRRREDRSWIWNGYVKAIALGWAIPGAGHWILGWRFRAALVAGLLLGTFWAGEAMSGGYAVTRKEHDWFFYAQIGNGASAILADRLQWATVEPNPPAPNRIDRSIPPALTTGILLTSVSGLLNMILVLHLLDPRTWVRAAAERRRAQRREGNA